MAQGFDNAKASTDIKHLLKISEISQDGVEDVKKNRNTKRTENTKILERNYSTQYSQHSKNPDKSSNKHINSNGNALLDSVESSSPDLAGTMHQSHRGSTSSNLSQSVPALKNKDHNNTKHSEIKSPSSAPFQKRSSENLESLEVVNSNRRVPSGFKNKKMPGESEVRNSTDSSNIVRKESNSFHSRNSSSAKNYKKNNESFRSGDDRAESAEKFRNRDFYKNDYEVNKSQIRRNEGSDIQKPAEMQSNSANDSKLHSTDPKDEELTKEFLLMLEENGMQLLVKRNLRFPKAKYYCDLCDFHLNEKTDCEKHWKDNRHSRKKKLNEMDKVLSSIPEPTDQQFAALTAAVEKVYGEHGINEREMKQRADIVLRLEKMLRKQIPDVVMFMYGSSLTGFGLKTSDINVDLTSADKNKKLTLLLKETYLNLETTTETGFSNLRSDFSAKVPGFLLMDDATGLTVHVIIHCYNAHCSSELLSIYSDFDIRVKKLAVAFRYWAHLCGLDRQCDGFIPPQALNLMVIYFLQAINPQLVPIIRPPKVTGDELGDYRKDAPAFEKMRAKVMKVNMRSNNNMDIGELWFRLLEFYCLEFDTSNVVVCIHSSQEMPRNTKPWNSKRLAVEDPYMLKRNITGMVNNTRIYEYWEDSIRKAFHYFGFQRDTNGKSHISLESFMDRKDSDIFDTSEQRELKENKEKVTHKISNEVGNLGNKGVLATEKHNDSKLTNVQHSQLQSLRSENKSSSYSESDNSNTGTNIGLTQTYDSKYHQQRMDGNYTSSSTHSNVNSSVCQIKKDSTDSLVCKNNENKNVQSGSAGSHIQSSTKPTSDQAVTGDKRHVNKRTLSSEDFDSGHVNSANSDQIAQVTSLSDIPSRRLSQSSSYSSSEEIAEGTKNMKLTDEKKDAFQLLVQKDCYYEFSEEFLTDGKGPVLVCTYCEMEGHLKNACPEDKLPEVLALPPLTPMHVRVLSETLSKVQSMVGLNLYDLAGRVNFMKTLEQFIQTQFKDANLALFGSSCNGFGFITSDMDICLTFSQRKVLDKPWLIESLAKKLKQHKDLILVQAISTAKVPIVKFTLRRNNLEGDISLYNILAQHNTKLLLCYSQIDPRVQILGYAIKNFAKVCDIGDASRGSLSSYAYILMMIYYLQQVTPPVIPVLQELYQGKIKPQFIIEDYDAWFMEDLSQLDNLWPEKGKNKMTVAELWLGFLRFYVEEFDYKEFVVSIRQKELLTRFEKLWNGESIAVEDPFAVDHNLGSALSRKMNNFIFKTFINGRMLYGSPIDDNMDMYRTYPNAYDYFFDKELLSEYRPPNVRGCRHCGKIGHIARSCPAARKDKDDQKGHQKQQKLQQIKQQSSPQQRQSPTQQDQQTLPIQSQQQQQKPVMQAHRQQSQASQMPQQQSQPSHLPKQQVNQPSHPPQQQQQRQPLLPQPKGQSSHLQEQQQKPLLQQEQRNPPQQVQSKPSQQQQRQPSQQQEQSRPSQQQQRQPPQQQEHSKPSQQQQQRQPLPQQQEQSKPLQQQQQRQPLLQQQGQIQPLQQQEQSKPAQQQQKQPLPQQQQKQPLPQQQEQNKPSQQQQQRQPLLQQQEHSKPSEQQQEQSKPLQQQQKQPSQQQEQSKPLQQQEQSKPLQQQQQRQPLQQQQQRQPLQQQEESKHQQKQWQPSQQQRQPLLQQQPQQQQQLVVQQEKRKLQQEQPLVQQIQRQPSKQHEQSKLQQKQPFQQQEQRQPPQQMELSNPSQMEQSKPSQQPEQMQLSHQRHPQQYQQQQNQRHTYEPEQPISQTPQQQKQPFQPQQQHLKQSPQPQQEVRQPFQPQQVTQHPQQVTQQQQKSLSPQPQQFTQSPQPHQQYNQPPLPHQQYNQPHQQYNQPQQQYSQSPPQQQMQPFQQQRQPVQPQLQQHNLPSHLQQAHPLQWQSQKLQELTGHEQDHWQRGGSAGNMNINSSASTEPYNFIDHQNIQTGLPVSMSSQVFHNTNYMQQHSLPQQQLLHGHYRHNNPVLPPLGSLPMPLIPPNARYNYHSRPPPLLHSNVYFPPGFPQAPHNIGYPHGNIRPHTAPGTHYSGHVSGGNNAGGQFMSPEVQNMFESAKGQVLNVGPDHHYRQK